MYLQIKILVSLGSKRRTSLVSWFVQFKAHSRKTGSHLVLDRPRPSDVDNDGDPIAMTTNERRVFVADQREYDQLDKIAFLELMKPQSKVSHRDWWLHNCFRIVAVSKKQFQQYLTLTLTLIEKYGSRGQSNLPFAVFIIGQKIQKESDSGA